MRTVKTLPLVLGGVAILGVVFLIYGVVQKIQPSGAGLEAPGMAGKPVDVFRMDGISYTAHDGGKVRFRLKADRVEVAKRKYGMLYVNPLKEATFSNLELEVHEDADARDPSAILSEEMFAQILPTQVMSKFGVITRIRIDGLNVKFVRNGQTVSAITARHAAIDPKTRMTALNGDVSVAAADGRSVRSQESTWDQAAGLFSIEGPYLYLQSGKVVQGNGARFDAELRGMDRQRVSMNESGGSDDSHGA